MIDRGWSRITRSSRWSIIASERIRVAGRIIEDGELDEFLTECEEAHGEQPITFFEITTAAAYLAFSRVPAALTVAQADLDHRVAWLNRLRSSTWRAGDAAC